MTCCHHLIKYSSHHLSTLFSNQEYIRISGQNANLKKYYENNKEHTIIITKSNVIGDNMIPTVMTIAGSDPSGGAGIQADIKALTTLGAHPVTVITCLTIQNTKNVKTVYPLKPDIIEEQIDVLMNDFKINIVKTGMMYTSEIVESITQKIEQYNWEVIIDPVLISTSGDTLASSTYTASLKTKLFPKAYMITPNIQEASILTNQPVKQMEDMKQACKTLHQLGPRYILLKGGHLQDNLAQDIFYDGKTFEILSLPKIPDTLVHGSGCTLASLIAGFLSHGDSPNQAVKKAKFFLWQLIENSCQIGKGTKMFIYSKTTAIPPSDTIPTGKYFNTWKELHETIDEFLKVISTKIVPEVGINIGYAVPNAKEYTDICAISGRIIKTREKVIKCGTVSFGTSQHVASIILAAMKFNPQIRAAMNIKYTTEILHRCKKTGLHLTSFNREEEPSSSSSTMEWGTTTVLKNTSRIPDVIYDTGAVGKEPMIRLLGVNPKDLLRKLKQITEINP